MLDTFHHALRWSHVAVGSIGLVLFWVPTLSKKGGRLHIISGKAFAACAAFMVATAFVSCVWGLASPTSFAPSYTSNPETVVERVADLRFFYSILLVVASWILQDLVVGLRSLKVKTDEDAIRRGFCALACSVAVVINVGAAANAGWIIMQGGSSRNWVLIVLGVIGLQSSMSHFQFIRNPRSSRMAWWYKHMECMLGIGVGFYTAFFVFGATRLFEIELLGWKAFIPWVMPALIGGPAITMWVRYYKKKFGEFRPKKEPARPATTT